jgi:GTPase
MNSDSKNDDTSASADISVGTPVQSSEVITTDNNTVGGFEETKTSVENSSGNKQSQVNTQTSLVTDVAFASTGHVNAGKSTLLSVIFHQVTDDSHGSARKEIASKNDIDLKRTTTIVSRSRVFTDSQGNQRAYTLIDLCGHSKYLKNTARGIAGEFPDYAFVVVGANDGDISIRGSGISGNMTEEHMRLLMVNNIPFMFVVTHMDVAIYEQFKITMNSIKRICESCIKSRPTMYASSKFEDYKTFEKSSECLPPRSTYVAPLMTPQKRKSIDVIKQILQDSSSKKQTNFPVILVSNVNGYGVDVVMEVITGLKARPFWQNDISNPDATIPVPSTISNFFHSKIGETEIKPTSGTVFYINGAFNPPGVGLVVSGINRGRSITKTSELFIGPINGKFIPIRVKSLHNNVRQSTDTLGDHHRGCIAFAYDNKVCGTLNKDMLLRGQLVVSREFIKDRLCYRFTSGFMIFNSSVTFSHGYCATVHMGIIRSAVRLTNILRIYRQDGTIIDFEKKMTCYKDQSKICQLENKNICEYDPDGNYVVFSKNGSVVAYNRENEIVKKSGSHTYVYNGFPKTVTCVVVNDADVTALTAPTVQNASDTVVHNSVSEQKKLPIFNIRNTSGDVSIATGAGAGAGAGAGSSASNTVNTEDNTITTPTENGVTLESAVPSILSLRKGDIAIVEFKFSRRPEFVEQDISFVVRSGDVQGVGLTLSVKSLEDDPDARPDEFKKSRYNSRKITGSKTINDIKKKKK